MVATRETPNKPGENVNLPKDTFCHLWLFTLQVLLAVHIVPITFASMGKYHSWMVFIRLHVPCSDCLCQSEHLAWKIEMFSFFYKCQTRTVLWCAPKHLTQVIICFKKGQITHRRHCTRRASNDYCSRFFRREHWYKVNRILFHGSSCEALSSFSLPVVRSSTNTTLRIWG